MGSSFSLCTLSSLVSQIHFCHWKTSLKRYFWVVFLTNFKKLFMESLRRKMERHQEPSQTDERCAGNASTSNPPFHHYFVIITLKFNEFDDFTTCPIKTFYQF